MDPSGAKGCETLKNHKAGSISKKFQEVGMAEVCTGRLTGYTDVTDKRPSCPLHARNRKNWPQFCSKSHSACYRQLRSWGATR
jgi:hypothetical protein